MKKMLAILLAVLMAAALLTSCASIKTDASSQNTSSYSPNVAREYSIADSGSAPGASPMPDGEYYDYGDYTADNDSSAYDNVGILPIVGTSGGSGLAEKIIYTVSASIETVDYDASVNEVYKMMAAFGAFVESSYIGGRNNAQTRYGWQTYRSASFTLRVPKDRLNAITESLGNLGNVISLQSDAQNITAQFSDTQSRLNSYKTQEERLLDMLARSDTIADMIVIEQRLGDIRYNIESFTSALVNWQNQVDYSTLMVYIQEVEVFTEIIPIQRTYWEQVGDGVSSTVKGVGRFFTDLLKWLIVSLPVLIILAVIAVVVLVLVKRGIKRRKLLYSEADARVHYGGDGGFRGPGGDAMLGGGGTRSGDAPGGGAQGGGDSGD
ncbi:MAG: DUF4349 domain-containing protein [Oscillospiraceae bacterium]|nr:DUF4349 domain-containing protein [Oscillospiraceae bacterium]